ncbi:MAG: T9SS type A sorting domain-containing protein [Paludibacteraceae bacterium]|nr:T9SS type A sorting domain-containing protein [Paludibacteraceae bacterium]
MLNINYAWGTTYTIITSIDDLSNGDNVVIATDDSGPSIGVSGYNSNKDATVSTSEDDWVEFTVGNASASGWTLYDSGATKYIASPGGNEFKYGATGGTCSVDGSGNLICNSRYLCINSANYRFYGSIGSYTPFRVWKVSSSVCSCTGNPSVSAPSKGEVSSSTAELACSGGVTAVGTGTGCALTSYGFVYNTSGTPTISDSKKEVGTTIATGTSFNTTITGLAPSTHYYVRAYATNCNGTAYSTTTIDFTTESKGCTDHAGDNAQSYTGTEYTYGPVDAFYEYNTRQILYTKADLGLAAGKKGVIKSIYFRYAYGTAMSSKTSVKIYMANTSLAALSTSNYVTSFTEVYSGALNGSGNGTWNEIILDSPFNYDGIGNLVVVIDDNSNAYDGTNYVYSYHTASTTSGAQLYTRSASSNADPTAAATWTGATLVNYRPATKFCIQEQDMVACTVTFNAGTGSCGTSSLTEPSAGAGVTLPAASHSCDGWDFAGWANASVSSETTSKPTLYTAGFNYKPSSDETLYAVYKRTEGSGSPATSSDSYDFSSSLGDWDGTVEDYFTQPCGFKAANQYAANSAIANFSSYASSATSIQIWVSSMQNGGTGSRLTISLINSSGAILTSQEITPVNGSGAGSCTEQSVTFSSSLSDATGYRMELTTKDKNVLVNDTRYTISYTSGTTTYYSNPVCCSGEKVGTPVVTATPSNAQIQLTWPTVTNATAYKLKWNGGDWETVTSPVTKSGLTNGTSYTYQVKAIGNGTTYCDGDPSAEASCVAGVSYTVTWMNNGETHTTTSVLSGEKPTFPATPISCDVAEGGESTVFYGWAEGTWIGKTDDISGETIYTSADDMPAVDGAVTYHAVFGKGSAASYRLVKSDPGSANWAGNYLIAYNSSTFADGRVGGKDDSGSIGEGGHYVTPGANLDGEVVAASWGDTYNVTLEKIGSSSTYLLKTKDGKYNYQTSNANGLAVTATKATAEEYPLSLNFESSSDIEISVAGTKFHYNASSPGYFRFYKDGGQSAIYMYKRVGGEFTEYMTSCTPCENRITISKGSESHGTFTLSKSGEQGTCSGPRVVTVTPTPDEHYRVASVTASNPATTGTAAVTGPINNAYTVTYSQNSKGATTISVTFEAIPQHTISLSPSAPAHGTTSLEAPGTTSVTIYEGTIVNLRVTPDECYELGSISITPESGYSELEQVDDDDYQILGITNNLTVAVTYAQRTQYTVTLDACTGTVSSTSLTQSDCGSVDLPSATPSEACAAAEGWSFAGWSRTKVNGETNTPPVLIPAGSFTPTASETLYAVYTKSSGAAATYWVKVYDDSKLSVGDSVIIVSDPSDYAMSKTQNTNNRDAVSITKSVTEDTLTVISSDVCKFVLQNGASSGTWAFYDPNAKGYLCAASSSNNYLKTQGTNDAEGSFEISINSIDGVASVTAQGSYTRNKIKKNNSNILFACYASGQHEICLYTKAMSAANVYNSVPSCLPCVSSEASLSSSALSLSTGKTSVVTLTSANTSAVSATSADPTIATVSVVGKELTINGLKEGETTITVEQVRDDPGESGHCEVYFELVVSVTTSTIEIIEWEREAVIIEYDGDADASVVLGKEVEHGSKTGNVATELFFSKYFEAAGEDKLLGIYNGTDHTIYLEDYFIWTKGYGTILELKNYGATTGQIKPQEEIIVYRYGTTGYSKDCMDTIPGHESWNEITWEGMKFSGRHSIGLYRKDKSGNDSIIDIIGATYYDKSKPNDYDPGLVLLDTKSNGGKKPSWGDESGFNAEGCGDNIMTKNDVETAYGLSTNRCLLVRKNTVTSGANALTKDTLNINYPASSNDALAATAFKTLCEEWTGYHVVGDGAAGETNTCEGMSEVAKFDYSNYYVTMETFSDDKEIGSYSLGDGTYRIPLPDLDTLACRLLRIQLAKDGEVIASSDPKVPIVVDANMSTNSAEFYKHSIDTCKVCDVVVRDNSTLTKAANGAANDRAEVRNITVYSGSHLIIPSGATNMKASSIVLRSLDDTVSTASFVGGIQFKDAGYHAYHSKRVKENRWYWFCLPHACRTNRITWQDGSLARLGTDFHLKYYDGEQRAATQSGGCWKEYTGSTIQPGVGYILSVEKREGHTYRELIFPMDTISEGETTKPVSVDDYGAGEDITPNHKGWNLVGNPYMTYYQKNTINAGDKNLPALTVGKLNRIRVDDPGDPTKHLLTYEILTDGVNGAPFVTVPVSNGNSEYTQVLLMDYDLPPFISYFVQIGDDAAPSSDPLYVNFAKADLTNTTTNPLQASYMRKRIQEEEDALEPILVTLRMQNGKNESDETTLIISDLYSNEYEIGSDLGKMFGDEYKSHSKPVFYSKMEDNTKLAFMSMPDASANEWTPLGFWGYNTQPITVSLRRNNRKLDYVESVMLYDKTMNTYTELLTDDYVLYPTKQGLFGSRLSVKVKVKRPTPAVATGMDEAHEGLYAYAAGNQQLVVAGIPEHATVWLYDALGKLIAMENTSHYMRTYTLPSSGVYFVRVNNEQGQRILRVIIK